MNEFIWESISKVASNVQAICLEDKWYAKRCLGPFDHKMENGFYRLHTGTAFTLTGNHKVFTHNNLLFMTEQLSSEIEDFRKKIVANETWAIDFSPALWPEGKDFIKQNIVSTNMFICIRNIDKEGIRVDEILCYLQKDGIVEYFGIKFTVEFLRKLKETGLGDFDQATKNKINFLSWLWST